ncbi:MAG TPA: hypothetical protein HA346_00820 [Thermoplasmata archaeon]|nr:hypothetical protein [Thermoplasmata archaeon]HIH97546.1 hypothetical protein [Thermoplasmata archaeon]
MRTLSLAFDPFGDGRINLSAQARDTKILIDPGLSLTPKEYSSILHPIELKRSYRKE